MDRDDVTQAGAAPALATRRDWQGLAVIALPCLLYAMDLTVLELALPRISEDLKPSSATLLWIVDIYGFLVAGLLITMGNLGDRIGRRRLLLLGAAGFGVASVIAALSVSFGGKRLALEGIGWLPVASIVAGAALGVAFARRQAGLEDPLIDLVLLRTPSFAASLARYMLATLETFGSYFVVAQYLQLVAGLSPLVAGMWMLPWSASYVVGSFVAPLLARRIPPPLVKAGGRELAACEIV